MKKWTTAAVLLFTSWGVTLVLRTSCFFFCFWPHYLGPFIFFGVLKQILGSVEWRIQVSIII